MDAVNAKEGGKEVVDGVGHATGHVAVPAIPGGGEGGLQRGEDVGRKPMGEFAEGAGLEKCSENGLLVRGVATDGNSRNMEPPSSPRGVWWIRPHRSYMSKD